MILFVFKNYLLIFLISLAASDNNLPSSSSSSSSTTTTKNTTITVAKCCGLNEILTSDNKCLTSFNSSWNLNIFINKSLIPFIGSLPPRWTIRQSSKPQCNNLRIEHLQKKTLIPLINGYMYSMTFEKYIVPKHFCIDYEYAIYCLENNNLPIVKKCCGSNAIFSTTNSSCRSIKNSTYDIALENFQITRGYPNCTEKNEILYIGKFENAQLIDNGSLWVNNSKILLPPANYCLDHIVEHDDIQPSIITCKLYLPSIQLDKSSVSSIQYTIYPIGLAISAIFLAATLAAGSLLPASHHVLHWRCQTNHVACLMIGDILLCIAQTVGSKFSYWFCFITGVSMHFLFLAAFFWLNTMCFNIWWTFRDLRPQSTEKSQERLRLYLYEAYAWGVPLIIVFIGGLSDLIADPKDNFLTPKFGNNNCWFGGNNEIFTYFFGPMGILMATNLVLFGLTARELTCGLWKRELVKSTTERAALGRVCAKLVVVMGVSWIMDVISWFVGGPQYLWYFTDLINCLQGVFIFIVVGCQPQVLSAVKRSWCVLRNRENGGMRATNHDHHSSSSHGLPSVGGETLTNHSSIANTTTTTTTKSVPLETNC